MNNRIFLIVIACLVVVGTIFLSYSNEDEQPLDPNQISVGGKQPVRRNEGVHTKPSRDTPGEGEVKKERPSNETMTLQWASCFSAQAAVGVVQWNTAMKPQWRRSSYSELEKLTPVRPVVVRANPGQLIVTNSRDVRLVPTARSGKISIAPEDDIVASGGWRLTLISEDLMRLDASEPLLEMAKNPNFHKDGFGLLKLSVRSINRSYVYSAITTNSGQSGITLLPGKYTILDSTLPLGWKLSESVIHWKNSNDQVHSLSAVRTPVARMQLPSDSNGKPIVPDKVTCFYERSNSSGDVDVRFEVNGFTLVLALDFKDYFDSTLYSVSVNLGGKRHKVAKRVNFSELGVALNSYDFDG